MENKFPHSLNNLLTIIEKYTYLLNIENVLINIDKDVTNN